MRFRMIWVAAFSLGLFALPAQAQGGLKKVAKDVSATVKKAGRDTKAEVHRDASKAHKLFGAPTISAQQAIGWVADWIKQGGATLGKPTHFEARDGKF